MPRQVFVSEFICGGAWPEPSLDSSLAAEGRAMLTAIIADLTALPDVEVMTTWDARLPLPATWSNCQTLRVSRSDSPHHEAKLFRQLSAWADDVLVIAPESGGLLAQRCRLVEALVGPRLCGSSSQAVKICADKLTLCDRLSQSGIKTISTAPFDLQCAATTWDWPIVIKPRDGAGAQLTFLVDNPDGLAACVEQISDAQTEFEFIQQPLITGRAVSVAALISEQTDVFPIGSQRLSDDGRFRYLGCDVPQPVSSARREQVADLVQQCAASIPGLRGYVGFDLILPDAEEEQLVLVEINPRLTTGYLAWMQFTTQNLADRMLSLSARPDRIRWNSEPVRFRMSDLD